MTVDEVSGNHYSGTFTTYGQHSTANNGVISRAYGNHLGNTNYVWSIIGNIGIATSSPFAKFSLAGDAYLGGNVTATGTLVVEGNASTSIINTTSTTASSTFANGINLTKGCFAINGTCLTSGSGSGDPFPFTSTADGNSTSTRLLFGNGFISQAS
jgi:hypothetical protein